MNWYLKVLKEHYADFKGRARRKEYWMFVLFNIIVGVIVATLDYMLGTDSGEIGRNGLIGSIYSLAVLIPTLAVTVRRLHDVGKSGWFLFIGLIPLIGAIWLLILFCTEGESKPNKWGKNPKGIGNDSDINQIGRE